MTEKQKRFCDEYLIDLNGTRAYKAAYPNVKSDKAAGAASARLLGNVSIRAYLDERLEQLHNERTADAAEVMEYLTSVLRGESKASVVVVESVGDGCSEARTITKPPDERERLKAAELLGKRFGLFTDKVNVSGSGVVQIVGRYPRWLIFATSSHLRSMRSIATLPPDCTRTTGSKAAEVPPSPRLWARKYPSA